MTRNRTTTPTPATRATSRPTMKTKTNRTTAKRKRTTTAVAAGCAGGADRARNGGPSEGRDHAGSRAAPRREVLLGRAEGTGHDRGTARRSPRHRRADGVERSRPEAVARAGARLRRLPFGRQGDGGAWRRAREGRGAAGRTSRRVRCARAADARRTVGRANLQRDHRVPRQVRVRSLQTGSLRLRRERVGGAGQSGGRIFREL